MRILNQPHSATMGAELKKILENNSENGFQTFYVIVAYVKSSGVSHLEDSIKKFKETGILTKAVVGIDQKNTSYQGLKLMLSLFDEIHVFHNNRPINTFHPKIYAFEKENNNAILFVGSSNLTEGGLFTNYETNSCTELNLLESDDKETFSEFKQTLDKYCNTKNVSQKLTEELLEKLKQNDYVSDETKQQFSKSIKKSNLKKHSSLFGNESIPTPSSKSRKARKIKPKKIKKRPTKSSNFTLVWKKENLPTSDAQQVKSGTAYTGNLKLTKANWKVNKVVIDQTKYFRESIFGNLKWMKEKENPYVEKVEARFHITIFEKELGVKKLTIRHKPSGESGQHNYTTYISWGVIQKEIINANITGKTLFLYEIGRASCRERV